MALALDRIETMRAAAIFLAVVALVQRYRIRWDTVFPWVVGAGVVGVHWWYQQTGASTYFDRTLGQYRTVQSQLGLNLPFLYREPDWIHALHTGLQTFPEQGVGYFRPVAQKLENIAEIMYYAETALGFDASEWSVARMCASEALNHLLGLQFRTDVYTPPARTVYAMVAFFRSSFMEKIPGFQPEGVQAVLSRPTGFEAREWYAPMG